MASILIFLFVILAVTVVYVNRANEVVHTVSYDWSIESPRSDELYAYASIGESWTDGTRYGNQYDITIYNNLKKDITDWNVTITVPEDCDIDSFWNGFWSLSDGKLYYEPADFNMTVEAGETKTFGLIMYSAEQFKMDEISIEYKMSRRLAEYVNFWVIMSLMLVDVIAIITVHIVDKKMA